jgi:diguanylate cyclase (GGDEF)-like protein
MLSQQHPLSVLMIDIDNFKSYNDGYGHAAGDQCLISIARLLGEVFAEEGELAARLGGEEFAVLLERVNLRDALARAEAVRRELYALNLPHPDASHGRVTISIGVSTVDPVEMPAALSYDAPLSGIVELLGRADQALYRAKAEGRNKVAGLTLWSRELV